MISSFSPQDDSFSSEYKGVRFSSHLNEKMGLGDSYSNIKLLPCFDATTETRRLESSNAGVIIEPILTPYTRKQ